MLLTNDARTEKVRRRNTFSVFLIAILIVFLCGTILLIDQGDLAFAADAGNASEAAETVPDAPETDGGVVAEAAPEASGEAADGAVVPTEEAVAPEEPEASAAEQTAEQPEEPEVPVPEEPEEEPDTTPPVVKYAAAAVTLGENVTPSTFVIHYEDESSVTLHFPNKPDTSCIGEYPVKIIAEDASGNKTVIRTTLYVCDKVIQLELEDRTYSGMRLREKVGTLHGYHPSIQQFRVTEEGASSFDLTKGDTVIHVGIQIRDTTRPKAKAVNQTVYLGYPKRPEEFVKDVSDYQAVTVSFLTEPDWDLPGERDVKIAITDASYNRSIIKVKTLFKKDDVPPVLTSKLTAFHYVGEAIAYKKGVLVVDNMDPACTLTVDKSKVKYREVGTYPITYTATDRDGNSSSLTVEITFREQSVSDEQLDKLADGILHDILKKNMTTAEKIKAIYNFCRYKIRYTGDSDKTDWKGEAYRGLTEFKGDCFTYYSAAYLLLNKIEGVEVLSVERLGGRTHHYWCLVNIGTGWYHYDTCPNHIYGTCFMRTSKQIQNGEGKVYWNFDTSLFPDVATKSFKMS